MASSVESMGTALRCVVSLWIIPQLSWREHSLLKVSAALLQFNQQHDLVPGQAGGYTLRPQQSITSADQQGRKHQTHTVVNNSGSRALVVYSATTAFIVSLPNAMAETSRVSANLHVQQWIYYIMLRGL